jgi:hypothetical protein
MPESSAGHRREDGLGNPPHDTNAVIISNKQLFFCSERLAQRELNRDRCRRAK